MKVSELKKILYTKIPREIEWSKGESYGFQGNVDDNLDINRVLYCVTPTDEVIQYAIARGCDLIISHHPYSIQHKSKIPHAIFHTALDCCEGGLNDQWRKMLEIKNSKHFDGTLGEFGEILPTTMPELVAKIENFIGHKIIGNVYEEDPTKPINTVVVCTGLGGMVTHLARETEADCYIIGEAVGPVNSMGFRKVIEVGHTLSERMGVHLLRELCPELKIDLVPLQLDYFGSETYQGIRRR